MGATEPRQPGMSHTSHLSALVEGTLIGSLACTNQVTKPSKQWAHKIYSIRTVQSSDTNRSYFWMSKFLSCTAHVQNSDCILMASPGTLLRPPLCSLISTSPEMHLHLTLIQTATVVIGLLGHSVFPPSPQNIFPVNPQIRVFVQLFITALHRLPDGCKIHGKNFVMLVWTTPSVQRGGKKVPGQTPQWQLVLKQHNHEH